MPRKKQAPSRVVVARSGDRTFLTPEICTIFTGSDDRRWFVNAEVRVVDAQPHFRRIDLEVQGAPMTALEVQRIPWARIAEAALAKDAVESVDGVERRAAGREVSDARIRGQRAQHRRRAREGEPPGQRRVVDRARLEQVVQLRAQAQRKNVRWDTFAAERLALSPAYVRKLYGRALDEGIA